MSIAFSNRLHWASPRNALSQAIAEKRRDSSRLFDLTNSNPTLLAGYPHPEIASAYGHIEEFTYRAEPRGPMHAREAVSKYAGVSPEQLIVTASTSEAYAFLFKLLCDPGTEILIPIPSYPLFEYLAALEGIRTISYPLAYDGRWHVDFHALKARISSSTRAIVAVSPNNPTGTALTHAEQLQLAAIADDAEIPVIVDEVFQPYSFGPPIGSFTDVDCRLGFVLNGLSKLTGMPQMKLGWIAVCGRERELALEKLDLIADTYLSVGTPVQNALPALLEVGSGIRHRISTMIRENYQTCREAFRRSPATVLHCEAGWSVILQLPSMFDDDTWTRKLLDENVMVQPGYFYDIHDRTAIVLSLLTDPEMFDEGILRIRRIIPD